MNDFQLYLLISNLWTMVTVIGVMVNANIYLIWMSFINIIIWLITSIFILKYEKEEK